MHTAISQNASDTRSEYENECPLQFPSRLCSPVGNTTLKIRLFVVLFFALKD